MFIHYLQRAADYQFVQKAMAALNDSYCSFYEVMDVGAPGLKLWDIAGKREPQCWNSSGYAGGKGEIWYARLLPPFAQAFVGYTGNMILLTGVPDDPASHSYFIQPP